MRRMKDESIERLEGTMMEGIETVKVFGNRILHSFDNMPDWTKDNEFILQYYRAPDHTMFEAFKSIFYLHNESINIWTHLGGAVLLLALGYYTLYTLHGIAFTGETVTWVVFLLSGLTCLGSSTAYHLFRQTNLTIYKTTVLLDYFGIAFLIFGSFASAMYYIFYCKPEVREIHNQKENNSVS